MFLLMYETMFRLRVIPVSKKSLRDVNIIVEVDLLHRYEKSREAFLTSKAV